MYGSTPNPIVPRRRLVLAGIGLSFADLACAAPADTVPKEIDLVTDESENRTRKDGSGMYFELVRAVWEAAGIRMNYRFMPYVRTVQAVKDKKADGWIASFYKEKDFPLYPQWHFDHDEQTVVVRRGGPLAYAGEASLAHRRVAWLRDFSLDRYIAQPMKITEVDTVQQAFQMLARDRIDYYVVATSMLNDLLKDLKLDLDRFELIPAMKLKLYIAFADTPRGAALRSVWDEVMATLHKTEAFRAIYKRYGKAYPFP